MKVKCKCVIQIWKEKEKNQLWACYFIRLN